MPNESVSFLSNVRRFLAERLSAIILLFGILTSVFIASSGILVFYKVALQDSIVPDINGPVSRFIATIDFETRTVNLDSTISKTIDAEEKIAIWRFGDGNVIKSMGIEEIVSNEVIQYQFLKPGTYLIGYSIVDANDLSDEAFCTVTFSPQVVETDSKNTQQVEEIFDGYDQECGKSTTAYNNQDNVYFINSSRAEIRVALFMIGVSLLTLVFTFLLNGLIRRLFKIN